MEIFRRVYCGEKYEGVYKLVFDGTYRWKYIQNSIGREKEYINHPKCTVQQDRNLTKPLYDYMLNLTIEFKEEDLEESYEAIKTIKD